MKSPAARLRAPAESLQIIETGVLVVGGGVAGCLAVIGAAEAGAGVVVLEKGGIIERAGSIAAGVDHFLIRLVAAALAVSALERRETRSGAGHVRVDFPAPDDREGLRIIMVEQEGGGWRVTSRPTGLPSAVLPAGG